MSSLALNGTADDDEYNAKNRENKMSCHDGWVWGKVGCLPTLPTHHRPTIYFGPGTPQTVHIETIGCLSLESYSFLETFDGYCAVGCCSHVMCLHTTLNTLWPSERSILPERI